MTHDINVRLRFTRPRTSTTTPDGDEHPMCGTLAVPTYVRDTMEAEALGPSILDASGRVSFDWGADERDVAAAAQPVALASTLDAGRYVVATEPEPIDIGTTLDRMRALVEVPREALPKATDPVEKGWGSPTGRGNGDRLRGSARALYGSGDFRGAT